MSIIPIKIYPDPVLRQKAEPVIDITDKLVGLLEDMTETMYQAPGIGLAAPQVGISTRACVVDVGSDENSGRVSRLYKLINPEIVKKEGKTKYEEGCLSIPGIHEFVERAEWIRVNALNEKGNPVEIEADGLLAICLQHEIDHLDGILFPDRLSGLKKRLVQGKLKKLIEDRQNS
ncbi:MAG TPA: peptide deformylase [Oligoflexia bacterium]|nr:peptide deformylase [Oligoflexia bacterium]